MGSASVTCLVTDSLKGAGERRRLCRDEGSAKCGAGRQDFVPPAVRPETRLRCTSMKDEGRRKGDDDRRGQGPRPVGPLVLREGADADGERVVVGLHELRGVRDLAPGGEEAVERGHGEARLGQRHDQPPECAERGEPVDPARLVYLLGDGVEYPFIIQAQNGTAVVAYARIRPR